MTRHAADARTTTAAQAPAAPGGLGHVHPALAAAADPRDVFLTAEDVHAYLGLGRSKGYEVTSGPEFAAIAFIPGRWRLADVRALLDARAGRVLGSAATGGDGPVEVVGAVGVASPAQAVPPAAFEPPRQPGGRGRGGTARAGTWRAS